MATFAQSMNTPGGYAAIGSIGNAINAMVDGRGQRAMYGQQTQQLREQIAFQRQVLEKQAALRAAEIQRQQMYAQAAGDAFANSLGMFGNVEGDIAGKAASIASAFQSLLSRPTPASIVPAASGVTADKEAAMLAEQAGRSSAEAQALAGVQAFGKTMEDKTYGMTGNDQLAGLLRNFAQGSQGVSRNEVEAASGKLYQPQVPQAQRSIMGDLFVGLSNLGVGALNQQTPTNPYALNIPASSPMGLRAGGGEGINAPAPAGLGLRLGGYSVRD